LENRNYSLKIIFAFASVYLIWGSTYLAMRLAIETIPTFIMAASRFLIAGSILFIFARIKSPEKLLAVHWKSAFITGGFLLLGGNGAVVFAEQYIPSGLAAVLVATVPVWVVIISLVIRKGEKPALKTVTGVLIGFAGLVYLVNPFQLNGSNVYYLGIFALLLASLSWSFGTVYTKYAQFPKSKITATAMQMLAGGSLLLLLSLFLGQWSEISFAMISFKSSAALLYLILFGSIIGYSSYIWLIGEAGPARASTYAYVNPVVAVFLGWLIADELITLRIVISTIVIITGVAIINSGGGKKIKRK
jgi:drug/metabolite transporter (DMT)-like permease